MLSLFSCRESFIHHLDVSWYTVTAGVLRGERSRFQLFGDTMNTASRMETTGERNRIQVSEETAKLLTTAGKEHWLIPREQTVEAKGKGTLTTYWLKRSNLQSGDRYSDSGGNSSSNDDYATALPSSSVEPDAALKQERLVKWFVELLSSLLEQIVQRRQVLGAKPRTCDGPFTPPRPN